MRHIIKGEELLICQLKKIDKISKMSFKKIDVICEFEKKTIKKIIIKNNFGSELVNKKKILELFKI